MDKNKFGNIASNRKKKKETTWMFTNRRNNELWYIHTIEYYSAISATCVSMHNFFLICRVERLGWYKVI